MTKEAALQKFYASFDVPAYEESSVPTGDGAPDLPYLTYSVATGSLGDEIALQADLWYRSSSWVEVNAKAGEISEAVSMGGVILPCDGGAVWLKRGSPFTESVEETKDDTIKRKHINITAEFFTAD